MQVRHRGGSVGLSEQSPVARGQQPPSEVPPLGRGVQEQHVCVRGLRGSGHRQPQPARLRHAAELDQSAQQERSARVPLQRFRLDRMAV